MSKATSHAGSSILTGLGIELAGQLALPDLSDYEPSSASIKPFVWSSGMTERSQSMTLLSNLRTWVTMGSPQPISNLFVDVQSKGDLFYTIEGVAHVTGKPDMIIAHQRIQLMDAIVGIASSAALSVDWKTTTAFQHRSTISAIGTVQALGFAAFKDFTEGQPVFLTDMATGFQCWMVSGRKLWYLHPSDSGLLTLAQGVALIRWFLRHETGYTASVEDGTLVRLPPLPGASSEGGVPPSSSAASAAVTKSRSAAAEVGKNLSLSGNKSKSAVRSGLGQGLVSRDVTPEKDNDNSCNNDYDDNDFDTIVGGLYSALAIEPYS